MLATIHIRTFCLLVSCLNVKIKMDKTIILPVVVYGVWNLVCDIKGQRRLRVFEDNVRGRISGPKMQSYPCNRPWKPVGL
jgi:hypothetical protein